MNNKYNTYDGYNIEEEFKRMEDELFTDMSERLQEGLGDVDDIDTWKMDQLNIVQTHKYTEDSHFVEDFAVLNGLTVLLLEKVARIRKEEEAKKIIKLIAMKLPKKDLTPEQKMFYKSKLNDIKKRVIEDLSKAEFSALRYMDDQYRKVIFNTQELYSQGGFTLREAIDAATKQFYENGIRSVVYKNGATMEISSYAEMALRTSIQRTQLQADAIARDEEDLHLVIINKREMACPRCSRFLGKVCIDDVFGGGKPDGVHPLLSEFMAGGLYHPNCKDTHSTYFPGMEHNQRGLSKAELEEINKRYNLEQAQRYNERQIRKWKRMEQFQQDPANRDKAAMKRRMWQERQRDFLSQHGELTRHYDREKVITVEKPTF